MAKKPTPAEIAESFEGSNVKAHEEEPAQPDPKQDKKTKLSPVRQVSPGLLTRNKHNTFNPLEGDELTKFTEDIREKGIIVPLLVYPAPGYPANKGGRIIAGHNRHTAALALGMETVPVQYIEDTLTEQEERRLIITDNLHRRQLTPEDKARLLAELYPGLVEDRDKGRPKKMDTVSIYSPAKIAEATGLHPRTVRRAAEIARTAKQTATAQGRPAPTPEDYKAAAAEKNQARKERETRGAQDLPGQADIDRKNRNTPAPKVSGPVPILEGILTAIEGKHKTAAARAALADLRTRLQAAGLLP